MAVSGADLAILSVIYGNHKWEIYGRILLENYFLPGDLEDQIETWGPLSTR